MQDGDIWVRDYQDGRLLAVQQVRGRFELVICDDDHQVMERYGSFPTMRAAALRANALVHQPA